MSKTPWGVVEAPATAAAVATTAATLRGHGDGGAECAPFCATASTAVRWRAS